MEYDELHEPVDSVSYVPRGVFVGSLERHTLNYTHFIRQGSVAITGERQGQQPLSESVSLLCDMPAPVKLEDDLEDPEGPFIGHRLGLRMRDDLDEPLGTQPPPQRTRFELVDDLHEPEDLSQSSETELNDDLHEPVAPPPPAGTTHDLHDDLDDPVVYPPSDPPMNDHELFDDLEEPVTTHQLSHRKKMRLRGELRDDLDDPEETGQGSSPPSGAGSELDHLYDDLDELMVDELISEVSDLVLQGHRPARGCEGRNRDNFGGQMEASLVNPVTHRSSVGHACIKSPLHAAQITPVSQQENHTPSLHRVEFERGQSEPRTTDTRQMASEQTAAPGSPSSACSGETRHASVARGSHLPSKGSQKTQYVATEHKSRDSSQEMQYRGTQHKSRDGPQKTQYGQRSRDSSQEMQYDGTQRTAMGSDASQQSVSAAGDASACPASSRSVAAEAQTARSPSTGTPSSCSVSKVHPGPVTSLSAQVCQLQSQSSKLTSNPMTVHSVTPTSSNESAASPSNFVPKSTESQSSLSRSPIVSPRSPSCPPSPPSQSDVVIPPPSPLPFLSRTPCRDDMPPPPPPVGTNAPASPTTPVTGASAPPVPPVTAASAPPVPPVSSTGPALGTTELAVYRRPAGSRGSHRAVQTGTVLARIDALLAAVATCRQRGETPELMLPARTRWRDLQLCSAAGHLVVLEETPRPEVRVRSESRLNMMVLLLQKIRHLVATNTHSTKRDIYYQEVSLFGSQRAVDTLLDDVTGLLAIPRESSHVRATSKGLVAGQLVLRCGDVLLDCSAARHGVLVPENVPHVQLVSSSARFILVVEKDATFQKILDSGVLGHLPPAIVITGKGFPDLNTRLLLRMLTSRLSVPALALLDADPHGLEIFFVYKYGSLARARESDRLTTPGLVWLGVRPTEVLQLQIPPSALLPLTAADRSKAQCLLSRPYVKHNRFWQRQIREILASGRKAEIQCLSAIHPTFLTDLYLPSKIQDCLASEIQDCLPSKVQE